MRAGNMWAEPNNEEENSVRYSTKEKAYQSSANREMELLLSVSFLYNTRLSASYEFRFLQHQLFEHTPRHLVYLANVFPPKR